MILLLLALPVLSFIAWLFWDSWLTHCERAEFWRSRDNYDPPMYESNTATEETTESPK